MVGSGVVYLEQLKREIDHRTVYQLILRNVKYVYKIHSLIIKSGFSFFVAEHSVITHLHLAIKREGTS